MEAAGAPEEAKAAAKAVEEAKDAEAVMEADEALVEAYGYPCTHINACIPIHALVSQPMHGYICMYIHAWISMHGYPCMDIHEWTSTHAYL